MRGPRILITVLAMAFFIPIANDAAAQAWTQPVDGYFFKLTTSYLSTDRQFNFRGDSEPIAAGDPLFQYASYSDISFMSYLEYGFTESFTLVATLPFKISSSDQTKVPLVIGDTPSNTTLTNGGLGDVWLSMRTPLLRTPTAISLQTGFKIPLGYEEFPDNGGPALGTAKVDAEASFFVGQSFYPVPGYMSAGVGYRYRGGANFDDEVTFNIEGGFTARKLFLKLRFDGLVNVGPIPDPLAGIQIPLAPGTVGPSSADANARNQDRFQINPVLAFHIKPSFALTAEAYHVLGGKNTISGTTWVVGIIFERGPANANEE